MARLFDGSDDKLAGTGAPLSAYPFTIACWFRSDAAAPNQGLATVVDRGATNQYALLRVGGANPGVQAQSAAGGTVASAVSGGTVAATTWQHACGVWTSATDRAAFLNGANKGTNTTSRAFPTGVDGLSVGCLDVSTPAQFFAGRICEVGVWNVALSDAEVAALARGVSPRYIRPSALVAYVPVYGTGSPEPDYTSGQRHMTVTGAVVAPHAPVMPTWGVDEAVRAAASAGTSEIPTPGGAAAAGIGPSARASAAAGASAAQGTAPTASTATAAGGATGDGRAAAAAVTVSAGGASAVGVAPSDGGGTSETPTPGGALATGTGPAAVVTSTPGAALAAGTAPLPASATPAGAAAADGGGPQVRVAFSAGGALAGGQLDDPLVLANTAHFDRPSPAASGFDSGSPGAGHFDSPSPGQGNV